MIEQQLLQAGIPVATWGTGEAKSLQSLVDEVTSGESVLVNRDGTLYRVLHVARINVYVRHMGGTLLLVEKKQEFLMPDGTRRPRIREHLEYSISEKLHASEDAFQAARRAVQEELGIASVDLCEFIGTTEETSESASYPGLMTRYLFQNFLVLLHDADYQDEYIEYQSNAATDPKLVYFGWQPMAPCGRCGGVELPLDQQGMCWHCRLC